jgi:N-acetylmuramoyl-L-alanine amidase
MKKLFLIFTVLLTASLIFASDGFVSIQYLETQPGITVDYDRTQPQIAIKGKTGTAKLIFEYPYATCGDKSARIDMPPFIENGRVFISRAASDTVMMMIGVTQEATAAEPVKKAKTKPKRGKKTAAIQISSPAVTVLSAATQAADVNSPAPETMQAQAAALRPAKTSVRKLVIIDPGHGDNDPGAIGPTGLQEKDVVLPVANRVKEYLKDDPNVEVLVTRSTDRFITLKNRAYFANEKKADLFVSIHCNSSVNKNVSGTRAYIYGRVASSKEAAEAAKYENKEVGVFEFLLNDLRKGAYEYLSIEAAGTIQRDLVRELKLKWEPTERAPFYVLANTNMPSVLVETAFISNPGEEQKMKSSEFRDRIALGISKGIVEYLEKIK